MGRIVFEAIKTIGYASVTGSYVAVGSPAAHNWRMFKITNNTDGDMIFSLDGTTDNIFTPANSFTLYDCSTNAQNVNNSDNFVVGINTQFYVRYMSVPTKGNIYIEGPYSPGSN